MGRTLSTDAVVLTSHRIGEIHRGVTFLSPELGIVQAIAHGAYRGKNRLGSATDLYCRSLMYLYHDPVKQTYKISDIVPHHGHEAIRTNLRRFSFASVWAEMVLRAFAGGEDFRRLFFLLNGAFDLLDDEDDEVLGSIMLQFLHRFVSLIGFMPDMEECGACRGALAATDSLCVGVRQEFLCIACAGPDLPRLTPGARRYFEHTKALPLTKAVRIRLDELSESAAVWALLHLLQNIIERPLNSLRSIGSFL